MLNGLGCGAERIFRLWVGVSFCFAEAGSLLLCNWSKSSLDDVIAISLSICLQFYRELFATNGHESGWLIFWRISKIMMLIWIDCAVVKAKCKFSDVESTDKRNTCWRQLAHGPIFFSKMLSCCNIYFWTLLEHQKIHKFAEDSRNFRVAITFPQKKNVF